MATQRQEMVTTNQTFSFQPKSLEEAEKYANIIANSGICPQALKGRPNDVLVILQMGHELNLKPMQALRSLGCINGMPFAYGDGLLALVKRHPEFENIKEWIEGDITKDAIAYCTITREGQEPQTRSFSITDATRAGLWKGKDTWSKYPQRMLQHRARGYACRDVFPDALYGLYSEEEVNNIVDVKVSTPIKNKGMSGLEEAVGIEPEVVDADYEVVEKTISLEENTLNEELLGLITEKNILQKSIHKWCKKFNVNVIQDIPMDGKQKIINHLKSMETK